MIKLYRNLFLMQVIHVYSCVVYITHGIDLLYSSLKPLNFYKERKRMKRYLAELVGTFFLTMAASFTGEPLAIGLMFMMMIYMVGPISGAHVNPAVSLAMWMQNRLSSIHLGGYVLAQIIGACLVSLLAYAAVGTAVPPKVIPAQALIFAGVIELLLSFVLVTLVLIVKTSNKFRDGHISGLILGLSLAGLASFIGTYNPAIALGAILPHLLLGAKAGAASPALNELLVYVIVPLIGGALAALHFKYMHNENNVYVEEIIVVR